jgi:undecaprenyl-diphosphatase
MRVISHDFESCAYANSATPARFKVILPERLWFVKEVYNYVMINYIHSIILGFVEGISEFLPISSTAHLVLASDLFKLAQSEFQKSFEVIVQLGAILAVVLLYWRTIFKIGVIKRLIVAFIPTGIIGLASYKFVKAHLLGNTLLIIWTLFIGGIVILIFEKLFQEKENAVEEISKISYKQCLGLGLFQAIAIIPGVSRSASTIIGGLLMGMKRKTIVEFSFLLAVPTMAAATGLDLLKNAKNFSSSDAGILGVGFIISFIIATLSIKFLLSYIRKHTFGVFGWYRILIAILAKLFI